MLKKILLVEDDLYTREFYEELLTNAGFKVETAKEGKEALKKIQNGGFSLILLDIVLPKLDGLGVLQKLKTNPAKHKNGPIMVLTNLAADSTLTSALENGASSYIIKSNISPDEVIKKVKRVLEKET